MAFWKPGTEAPGSVLDRVAERGEATVASHNPYSSVRLSQQRRMLPVFRHRDAFLYALETHRTVVVVGETGSGKSTQLPQYLHEAGWTAGGRMVACTQPRRVAAMSLATRVADEMGARLGAEVGYTVRFDDHSDPTRTRIRFMTDGILLRETMLDPLLSKYSVIILDEAHERSLETDILMGLLKKIQRRRPFLRLIVSSATLEAEKFKQFFETNMPAVLKKPLPTASINVDSGAGAGAGAGAGSSRVARRRSRWGPATTPAPLPDPTTAAAPDSPVAILCVEGRQHAVDVMYLKDPAPDYVRAVVNACVDIHMTCPPGDILAFLPASEDIDNAVDAIQEALPRAAAELVVRPLYAALPWDDQMKAITPGRVTKRGQAVRKCVVATNIAETSVTIPDVVYVVDSGFVKMPVFNPLTGMESLLVQPVSQAQAMQRAGRAGRVKPGKCLRLYTEPVFKGLRASTPPEMVRTNLAPVALQLKALGITNLVRFEFMDPPPAEALVRALELLYALGALDEACNLTEPLGRQMAEFPAEPRLTAMLLASLRMGCAAEALTIAACCSVKSLYRLSRDKRKALDAGLREFAVTEGDHLTMLNVYNGFLDNHKNPSWCAQRGFDFRALCRVSEIRRQLRRYLARVAVESKASSGPALAITSCDDDNELVRRCIVTGFFSNAARLAPDASYTTVKDKRRVELDPSSIMYRFGQSPEWVVYHDVTLTSVEYIREVTVIDPRWLTELAKHYYELKGKKEMAPAPVPGQRPGTMPSTAEAKREAKREAKQQEAKRVSKKRLAPGADAIVFRTSSSGKAAASRKARKGKGL